MGGYWKRERERERGREAMRRGRARIRERLILKDRGIGREWKRVMRGKA